MIWIHKWLTKYHRTDKYSCRQLLLNQITRQITSSVTRLTIMNHDSFCIFHLTDVTRFYCITNPLYIWQNFKYNSYLDIHTSTLSKQNIAINRLLFLSEQHLWYKNLTRLSKWLTWQKSPNDSKPSINTHRVYWQNVKSIPNEDITNLKNNGSKFNNNKNILQSQLWQQLALYYMKISQSVDRHIFCTVNTGSWVKWTIYTSRTPNENITPYIECRKPYFYSHRNISLQVDYM